jgi:hypothetical protein
MDCITYKQMDRLMPSYLNITILNLCKLLHDKKRLIKKINNIFKISYKKSIKINITISS